MTCWHWVSILRTNMYSFRNLTVGFGVILVVTFSLLGCHSKHDDHKGPHLEVTNPWQASKDIVREYVAQIKAIQHIELRAFEKGYLQNIFVDEGQLVKKDEKMFEITPILNKAEYRKAKAEANLAGIEYKNTKQLADKNIVSPNELALAKAKLDKAEAELELAKAHLDFTLIKAPFDGLMDKFHVRLGSLIEEGELLSTLSDNSKMWVYFNVTEAEYLNYQARKKEGESNKVQLRLANGQLFDQEGTIDTIEADFNNETGNIAFRATFPNPDGLLRHGETGSVLVKLPIKDALLIPQKSTYEILDKKFVYVLDEKNKLQSRQIKIKAELPHLYIIESGLTPQDKILVDGIGKVEPGMEIEPNFKDSSSIVSHLDVPAE
jgi:membrane fusion protein (multidrug efflux system)